MPALRVIFIYSIGNEGIKPFVAVLKKFPEVAFEFYNFNKVCSININEK